VIAEPFAADADHEIATDVVVLAPITGLPGAPGALSAAAKVDTADEGSVLMPVPMRFTADTLKTYDDDAASPVTVMVVAAEAVWANVDHEFSDARRYCTT
jgi:hypothetical protein